MMAADCRGGVSLSIGHEAIRTELSGFYIVW